ncbi:MAG: hypothetical protein ACLPVW_16305 [Terriglobales bacterium]
MDGKIENGKIRTEAKPPSSGHLMCRTPLWGLAGFLGCAYFAWISFGHVTNNEYEWPHDLWTAATYIVWIVLLAILAFDTRCLRERMFFGVLVINFIVGCALTLWRNVPPMDVRMARIGTGALWTLAALVSLTTLRSAPELRGTGAK